MTIQDVCALVGVDNIDALRRAYEEVDKQRNWDYNDPTLLTNQIKIALEQVDPDTLGEYERGWRREILWFWYHHAISHAIWVTKDRIAARRYAAMALLRQGGDHPNKITRLLYLLVHDRLQEALIWASWIEDEVEGPTADGLVLEYMAQQFF